MMMNSIIIDQLEAVQKDSEGSSIDAAHITQKKYNLRKKWDQDRMGWYPYYNFIISAQR